MQGRYGHGLEAATHLSDKNILSHLKCVQKAFDTCLGGVDWEAIGKDRKDERMKNPLPICIVQSADRIAKYVKSMGS